jgi:hypothetical protein
VRPQSSGCGNIRARLARYFMIDREKLEELQKVSAWFYTVVATAFVLFFVLFAVRKLALH